MKIDPLFIEKYIISIRVKIFDYLTLISVNKFQRNKSNKREKSFFLMKIFLKPENIKK